MPNMGDDGRENVEQGAMRGEEMPNMCDAGRKNAELEGEYSRLARHAQQKSHTVVECENKEDLHSLTVIDKAGWRTGGWSGWKTPPQASGMRAGAPEVDG